MMMSSPPGQPRVGAAWHYDGMARGLEQGALRCCAAALALIGEPLLVRLQQSTAPQGAPALRRGRTGAPTPASSQRLY